MYPQTTLYFLFRSMQNYLILTFGLGVFGAYMGAWSPPLYAIYADSVASGQRSAYETVCIQRLKKEYKALLWYCLFLSTDM